MIVFHPNGDSIGNLGPLRFFFSKSFIEVVARGSLFKAATICPEVVERHQSSALHAIAFYAIALYGGSPRDDGAIRPVTLLCLPGPVFGDGGGNKVRRLMGGNL